MSKSRFSKFLITALSLTAFLVGYLVVQDGLESDSGSRTGTILDKFGGSEEIAEPKTEETAVFLVTNRQITSLTNSLNRQSVLYYEKNTGKIFEFDLDDKKEGIVSDTMLPDFISTAWSPNKKEVISSFRSKSGVDYRHYNVDTDKTTKLNSNIRSLAFSPDGNLIAYYYFENIASSGNGKIMLSQPNGDYQKKLIDTRIENIEISWPTKDQIIIKTPASEIFLLTEDGKLNRFMNSRVLFEEVWSFSGKKMLFSALNDEGYPEPVLSVKEVESKIEKSLDIAGNASKCVWSIDDINILCALSKSSSEDVVYSINTTDNSKKLIAEPGMVINKLSLSNLEDYLLFISASDEKLYGIKISD